MTVAILGKFHHILGKIKFQLTGSSHVIDIAIDGQLLKAISRQFCYYLSTENGRLTLILVGWLF